MFITCHFDNDASHRFQPTVHGVCPTDVTINARGDIDLTVSRDLSKCDSFFARRQDTSPLALITGMVRDQTATLYVHRSKLKPRLVRLCIRLCVIEYLPVSGGLQPLN